MDRLTHLQSMTHEELVNRVLDLEKTNDNTVYSIDREDLAYVLMTMTSVPEAFITEELIDEAQARMRGRFVISEETEQVSDFLIAQDVAWATVHGDFSGFLDNNGDVIIFFAESQGEKAEADIVLSGDEETASFFEHIMGDGWREQIEDSPYFTFNREKLSGFDYQG